MGEKRPYKARKPGGGRKKLKPEYDAGKNLKEQMESAVALYEEECSLQDIANALNLNPIKVRKLLITAGVYESDECNLIAYAGLSILFAFGAYKEYVAVSNNI